MRIAGPDAYRDLPRLLQMVRDGANHAMNVQLSVEETYADVAPVRSAGSHAAFVSIMRGCNNMCSFCVVPYTRCDASQHCPVRITLYPVLVKMKHGRPVFESACLRCASYC